MAETNEQYQESTLHLVLRLRGGGCPVSIRYKEKLEEIWPEGMTIGELKLKCYQLFGVPVREQHLIFNGKELENSQYYPLAK